tara:strand:- start:2549 stop:2857 length:309 start_codon:yes stop_codon:yes gene_type:complete
MPTHYGEKTTKKGNARKGQPAGSRLAFDDTKQEADKMKKESPIHNGKMSDKQKADLNKHMEKHKKAGMSQSELKSHRMKMMTRMRKGMSVTKAHNDIKKSSQ